MVLRLLWRSLLAFLLFEFRAAYIHFLLAALSLALDLEEVTPRTPDAEPGGDDE